MLPKDKRERKETPLFSGLIRYFPDALAAVAQVSFKGNAQHNPNEPLHWSRDKSKDHHDCAARHLWESGTIDDDGMPHSAKLAWRALALLQLELEAANKVPPGDETERRIAEALDYEYEQARKIHNELQVEAAKLGKYDTPHKNIVYISGPMRKIPDHNFPAFDEAKRFFQELGYDEIISPADMDRADNPAVLYTQQYYADRDIAAINHSTHVAVLNGWEHSDGATAEVFYARWVGRKIVDAETGGPVTKFNAAAIEDGMRRWLGVKA